MKKSCIDIEGLRILIRRKDIGSKVEAAAHRVNALVTAGAAPKDVAEAIARHPELTLRVMRMASSAAFSRSSSVNVRNSMQSVLHAVETLGFSELTQLLSMIAFSGFLSIGEESNCEFDHNRYRQRCLLIGLLSREIAKKSGIRFVELPFTAGLLQESGYVATERFFPDAFHMCSAAIRKTPGASAEEIEEYYLGVDHATVGAIVAEEYHLDPIVVESIRYHHAPSLADVDMQSYVDIAHVCGWMADAMGLTMFGVPVQDEVDPFALKRLGYTRENLEPLLEISFQESVDLATALS